MRGSLKYPVMQTGHRKHAVHLYNSYLSANLDMTILKRAELFKKKNSQDDDFISDTEVVSLSKESGKFFQEKKKKSSTIFLTN